MATAYENVCLVGHDLQLRCTLCRCMEAPGSAQHEACSLDLAARDLTLDNRLHAGLQAVRQVCWSPARAWRVSLVSLRNPYPSNKAVDHILCGEERRHENIRDTHNAEADRQPVCMAVCFVNSTVPGCIQSSLLGLATDVLSVSPATQPPA